MKKHYGKYPGGTNYYVACGLYNSARIFTVRIRSKVTCKRCKNTKRFRKIK